MLVVVDDTSAAVVLVVSVAVAVVAAAVDAVAAPVAIDAVAVIAAPLVGCCIDILDVFLARDEGHKLDPNAHSCTNAQLLLIVVSRRIFCECHWKFFERLQVILSLL